MNLLVKDCKQIENSEEIGYSLIDLIEENLDIKHNKFQLRYTNFRKASQIIVIYESEWCNISFMFSRQRFPQQDELVIEYGRLHAPNEEPFMVWNGDNCRCWHNVMTPLCFLDGLSPLEAYQQSMIDKQLPRVIKDFRHSVFGKKLLAEYPPKSGIVLQSEIWKHYGQKLFDLFDLRKPDLWQEYRSFLKEYYGLTGEKSVYGPPYENVC